MYILLGFALIFGLAALLRYFGTGVRVTERGVCFGFKRYSPAQLAEYDFTVSHETLDATVETSLIVSNRRRRRLLPGGSGVPPVVIKVSVCRDNVLLHTHIFTRPHQQAAQKLIAEINRGIEAARSPDTVSTPPES